LRLPDIKARLNAQGGEPLAQTPTQFAELMRSDHAQRIKVIRSSGIKLGN